MLNEDEEMDNEHSATLSSDDDGSLPDRARKRKAGGTPGRKKRARSASQERGERKRGRPRKNVNLRMSPWERNSSVVSVGRGSGLLA